MTGDDDSIAPGDATPVSWREILTPEYLPRLGLLILAVWLHAANSMLTATVMPSVVDEIGGLHLVSWAFALYLIGSIVAGPSVSLLIANNGLKKTMVSAALLYAVGCAICAMAPAMWVLLSGRAVQGLGGGALLALVYVSQDKFFPNRLVPKVVAAISTIWMASAFAGPLIGGAFATWGIWRMAFWVFVVQAILLVVVVNILLRKQTPPLDVKAEPIPIVRLIFLASAVLLVSMAGARFDPLWSPLLIVAGAISLGFFIYRDKKATRAKMLPAQIIDLNHIIGNGIATTFLMCLCLMAFLVYGPLILIELYGLTPLSAGLVVMVETVAWTIGSIMFSSLPPRQERKLIRICSAMIAISLAGMAWSLPHGPLWLLIANAFLLNFSFGSMWGFIIKRIIGGASKHEKDRTSSLIPSTQQLGFALSAALAGLIANGLGIADNMPAEDLRHIAFWIFACFVPIALLGNITAWRFTR